MITVEVEKIGVKLLALHVTVQTTALIVAHIGTTYGPLNITKDHS